MSATGHEPLLTSTSHGDTGDEFIRAGADFNEAVGKTIFFDRNQTVNVFLYFSQLAEFEMWEEIEETAVFLNMQPGVEGLNRWQALMAKAGILVPEWGHTKLTNAGRKQVEDIKRLSSQRRDAANEHLDQHPA